jgi:hypothetical protein
MRLSPVLWLTVNALAAGMAATYWPLGGKCETSRQSLCQVDATYGPFRLNVLLDIAALGVYASLLEEIAKALGGDEIAVSPNDFEVCCAFSSDVVKVHGSLLQFPPRGRP